MIDEIQLFAEFERGKSKFQDEARRYFEVKGIPCATLEKVGGLGRETILVHGNTYMPDPQGRPAVLLGVWWPSPPA